MAVLISRGLASFVAVCYLLAALIGGGPLAMLSVAVYLLLPMACIWFSDEMGSVAFVRGMPMNDTPGIFVAFGGWLLLLMPVWISLYRYIHPSS